MGAFGGVNGPDVIPGDTHRLLPTPGDALVIPANQHQHPASPTLTCENLRGKRRRRSNASRNAAEESAETTPDLSRT